MLDGERLHARNVRMAPGFDLVGIMVIRLQRRSLAVQPSVVRQTKNGKSITLRLAKVQPWHFENNRIHNPIKFSNPDSAIQPGIFFMPWGLPLKVKNSTLFY